MASLSGNLLAASSHYPDRVAIRVDERTLTYAEFNSAAACFATFLEQSGIKAGDRVGVMLPNSPAFAIVFYGIMHRGAVAVPMNPLLKTREVEFHQLRLPASRNVLS